MKEILLGNGGAVLVSDEDFEWARIYDEAARKHHGEFACVNFPRPGEHGALAA